MSVRDFNAILSEWHIDNEGERWLLKRQFLRNNPAYYRLDDFVDFLKQRFDSPPYHSLKKT